MEFERLGERISFVRGNISQAEFAKALGVSRNTLIRYEKNETEPTAGFIISIATNYGTDVNWLLFGESASELNIGSSEMGICANCEKMEKQLSEERAENHQLVKELREQTKEIIAQGKENRTLSAENRKLREENEDYIIQINMLEDGYMDHDDRIIHNSVPEPTRQPKRVDLSGACCLLPEDARNKDKYEERQE